MTEFTIKNGLESALKNVGAEIIFFNNGEWIPEDHGAVISDTIKLCLQKCFDSKTIINEIIPQANNGHESYSEYIFIPVITEKENFVIKLSIDATSRIAKQKVLEIESKRSQSHMSIIHEIGAFLHGTLALDEVVNMILVAATSGQGLKFNRAFLFLTDESGE